MESFSSHLRVSMTDETNTDDAAQLKAVINIRVLLCTPQPDIEFVIGAGWIPILVNALEDFNK